MINDTTQNPMPVENRKQLTVDITKHMLKGGGYALIVVAALVVFILVLAFIGRALPEESREQPDPTPLSQVIADPDAVQPV